MNKSLLLVIFIAIVMGNCTMYSAYEQLYDVSFLSNYSAVREFLKKEGFREIYFRTPDNLRLNGLFLERENARCTVILCAGWFPGRMEGLATFYDIIPSDCNILFFTARGRGKSDGSLLGKWWEYGLHEYQDILGAISCVRTIKKVPIVICGICAGGFNAAHALIYLEAKGVIKNAGVRGFIFDSGWGSVEKVLELSGVAGIKKRLLKLFSQVCALRDRQSLENSLLYKVPFFCLKKLYIFAYVTVIKPSVKKYQSMTTLFDKIDKISLPILFMHSHNDTYADAEQLSELASFAKNKQFCWFENSSHAAHHLKNRSLYKQKMAEFIDAVV